MEDKTNTPEEVLDLVDENDNVIGEVLKREANKDPRLIHREAGVLLFNADKKVLFQKRSLKKLVSPGEWQVSAAGHVTKDLTPLEAAHKELMEELGFDTDFTFVEKALIRRPYETHFAYRYIGKYEGQEVVVEKDEVDEARLFSEAEFNKLISTGVPYNENSYLVAKRFWKGEFDYLLL